ncbi:MAG TPA: hypothetical protein VN706_01230 [Gemmatimonadaceae bacterium]|nr:hypothetical protein [Gemmatimonadaceae bacterium]
MTDPTVFWPALLGLAVLVAGLITYRRDAHGLAAFGPVLVAASLAAFAGEHFTIAPALAGLVPKWLPGRLFIAYFVGVAHLAAALSFVARRYVRWSSLCLAVMFALFVLLMDLPGAITHPTTRLFWSLAARETTYAIGALALFATVIRTDHPQPALTLARIARIWTAFVLVFYGLENLLYPQFSPGVPDVTPTAAWIPFPRLFAYATGLLLVAFGIAMLAQKHAASSAARSGLLMTLLTVALYVPQFFLAHDASQQLNALNFIFDTLLFAGMMLVISHAVAEPASAQSHS